MRKVKKLYCTTGFGLFTEAMIAVWKARPVSYDTGYFMRYCNSQATLYVTFINRNFAVYQKHKRL